jgi:hypothetical protein
MTSARRCGQPGCTRPRGADSDEPDHEERVAGTRRCADRRPAPRHHRRVLSMAVIEDVRPLGAGLERSYQVYVRGRLKFRVKQIVYVAFSLDESVMGFAFPKEERSSRASRTGFRRRRRRICASTGSTPNLRHWTRPKPASSSSMLGAWSSPRSSPGPTTSSIPTARAEARASARVTLAPAARASRAGASAPVAERLTARMPAPDNGANRAPGTAAG